MNSNQLIGAQFWVRIAYPRYAVHRRAFRSRKLLSFAKKVSADNVLCGNKFISVMQVAQLRDLDNPSNTRDLPIPPTLLV